MGALPLRLFPALAGALTLTAAAHAGPCGPSAQAAIRPLVAGWDGWESPAPPSARRLDSPAPPPTISALALPSPALEWIGLGRKKPRPITSKERSRAGMPVLSAARAQILLRSLTVPGWGQATLGRRGAAKVFFLAESGVWATFTAFRIQEQMRRHSYERSARVLAGIELRGRDEEFRRIVGGFRSSDDYNLYVVYRDAATLYYFDNDLAKYWAYIAEHSLKGRDAWSWRSDEDLLRYRAQRKDAQRAAQRANIAVAAAVVNRFLSAVHVARLAGRHDATGRSWNLEVAPARGEDAMAFRCGVRARF